MNKKQWQKVLTKNCVETTAVSSARDETLKTTNASSKVVIVKLEFEQSSVLLRGREQTPDASKRVPSPPHPTRIPGQRPSFHKHHDFRVPHSGAPHSKWCEHLTLNSSCRDKLLFMAIVRLPPPPPPPHPAAAGEPRADASVCVAAALAPAPALAGVAAALWRGAPWNTDAWKAVVPDTHPVVRLGFAKKRREFYQGG